jgi:dimeric dUTPase (all-alpha-NTP-PPase superfamily)
MELVFNEISFLPDVNDEYILTEHFIAMLSLYDKVEDFGFNHLVFPANISSSIVSNGKTFIEWVSSIPHQGNKNKIGYSFIRPFLRGR